MQHLLFGFIKKIWPVYTYIFLTLLIGEEHPFSYFPMFSHFPPQGECYYVKDEQGNSIPLRENFKITGDELLDMFHVRLYERPDTQIRAENSHLVAGEVAGELADRVDGTVLKDRKVSIMMVSFTMDGDSIWRNEKEIWNGELIE